MRIERGKHVILIDAEDLDLYESRSWHVHTIRNISYLISGKSLLFHRLVMNPPAGMSIDHINGNGLDNRKSNLRICTHAENMRNRKLNKNNKSGYKGVHFDSVRKMWMAKIKHNTKTIYLGYYDDPEKAHEAYCRAASKYHGEFVRAGNL